MTWPISFGVWFPGPDAAAISPTASATKRILRAASSRALGRNPRYDYLGGFFAACSGRCLGELVEESRALLNHGGQGLLLFCRGKCLALLDGLILEGVFDEAQGG